MIWDKLKRFIIVCFNSELSNSFNYHDTNIRLD
nr:MAG TPA: hypothetical protein [Bacteriophage sp.]